MSSTFTLSRYIIAAAIMLAFGYALFATHTLWRGPVFVYLLPQDTTVTTSQTIIIEGHARRAQEITINGFEITQDLRGYFAEEFALAAGENTFIITLSDKFGHEKTRRIRVIQEGAAPSVPVPSETQKVVAPQEDTNVPSVSSNAADVVL